MSIRINSNIISQNAQRRFNEATKSLGDTFSRLSSGLRINKASDDAAGLSVSSLLQIDRRISSQAVRNINDGVSYLNVAESALTELTNIVTRIGEIAEQSANGTLGQQQRDALQREVSSLQEEYNRIIKTTSFNNNTLLTGVTTSTILQGGYGTAGQLSIQVGEASLRLTGDETRAGRITRVDSASDGTISNNNSYITAMSADGRYVGFSSTASNLIQGDTNGIEDVYVKDTVSGQTRRASTDSSGAEANGTSSDTVISADGRYVAFNSNATNLVTSDTNGVRDVFIKDLITGTTRRVNTDRNGVQECDIFCYEHIS